jgi:hypothetical protein
MPLHLSALLILIVLAVTACGSRNGRTAEDASHASVSQAMAGAEGQQALSTEQEQRPTARQCADEGGHDEWPGPWTLCPQADWVRQVVRETNYRLAGETGSALIAEGNGRSFFIWATPVPRSLAALARSENWKLLGRVDGSRVWGGEDWRWWVAQDHIFWVSVGPQGLSRAPAPNESELGSLIRASKTLPRPPA